MHNNCNVILLHNILDSILETQTKTKNVFVGVGELRQSRMRSDRMSLVKVLAGQDGRSGGDATVKDLIGGELFSTWFR